MNQHNNPPFQAEYINQKPHANPRVIPLTIGKPYTITETIFIEDTVGYRVNGYEKCADGLADAWYWEGNFRIITKRDHSNVEISEEIKNLAIVEERSDVKKKEIVA